MMMVHSSSVNNKQGKNSTRRLSIKNNSTRQISSIKRSTRHSNTSMVHSDSSLIKCIESLDCSVRNPDSSFNSIKQVECSDISVEQM